ncbi:MAG: PAS domain S-box protein [Alphaproteobacteria bacterium]|nr:PAS domain S-box protein [Alphaproteobacteria bacterium]
MAETARGGTLSAIASALYSLDFHQGSVRVVWASDNVRAVLGWEPAQCGAVPDWWGQHIHPEDRDAAETGLAALSSAGDLAHDYRLRRNDGTYVRVRDEARVTHRDQDGRTHVTGCWTAAPPAPDGGVHDRLRDAVESLSEGFLLWDADDRLVFANSRFLELYSEVAHLHVAGVEFEAVNRVVAETGLMVEARGREEDFLRERVEQHRNPRGPYERRLGADRWLLCNEHKTRDGGTVFVFTEITERKQREVALAESERKFRNLIEGSAQGILIHQSDRLLFANQALADLLGYDTPEDVLATGSVDDHVAPEERARTRAYGKARLAGEPAPTDYEFEALRRDGTRLWLNNRSMRVEWEGEPAIQTFLFDVTDRRRADEALRESETQFRLVTDALPLAIFFVDIDLRYRLVNKNMAERFDLSPAEVVGRSVVEVLGPENLAVLQPHIAIALTGQGQTFEVSMMVTGGKRDVLTTYVPHRGADGAVRGFFGVSQDITERKRLEEGFRQTQKLEAIGQLAGGIAHDFNNILQIIAGFTELSLKTLSPGSTGTHYLQKVLESSERARSLVQQILTFSGREPARKITVDLGRVVPGVIEMLRATLPATITIDRDFAAADFTVTADPTQIEQVIVNLCTNAAHAMRNGGGRLLLSLDRVDFPNAQESAGVALAPGAYTRLGVADTGHGMDEETRQRIFEPFYTTKSLGEGSGLGLAVVHGIVTDHDGAVTVDSAPGQGTGISVYLPVAKPGSTTAEPDRGDQCAGGTERILFVDDEPQLVEVAAALLSGRGYRVVTAQSAAEALALFARDPMSFDLVISDQTMPGMAGDALARALLDIRADLAIILCTGYSHSIDEAGAYRIGIRELVMKPLIGQDLFAAVRRVIDRA